MALIDEITGRIGNKRLVQLTNDDNTATTVNTDVLGYACADAEGLFEDITGIIADYTSNVHLPHLIQAAMYFLETYKGRDAALTDKVYKRVVGGLRALRARQSVLTQTNSVLSPSEEQSGSKPDFDRRNRIFFPKNYKQNVQLIRENNE